MEPLALVANLATRWCHLHYLQIWPPDGIGSKFGHQPKLATRLRYLYYYIALDCPIGSYQLSFKKVLEGLSDGHPDSKIGPQVYLGPIKIPIK